VFSSGLNWSNKLVRLEPSYSGARDAAQTGHKRQATKRLVSFCLFDFESFGGFGKEVRSTLREAANHS
jgi:hypothetical protein